MFQFHSLQKFSDEVAHAVLSRAGGFSKKPYDTLNVSFTVSDEAAAVRKNRKLVCRSFGIPEENLIAGHQIHSKYVVVINDKILGSHKAYEDIENVDAFVTDKPGVALMIKAADCQSILMFDPVQKVVAAAHAGWKGLAQDISGEALKVMKKHFKVKPENVMVAVSPSLGPCCAFFSNPEKELPPSFKPYIAYNKTVDLWQFSIDQLKKHGVQAKHIELARVCTMCGGGDKFYSFRRDRGMTGRFGTVIVLKPY